MHSQLRERIRLMRARLDNAAPVAEIRAESQLFVTWRRSATVITFWNPQPHRGHTAGDSGYRAGGHV